MRTFIRLTVLTALALVGWKLALKYHVDVKGYARQGVEWVTREAEKLLDPGPVSPAEPSGSLPGQSEREEEGTAQEYIHQTEALSAEKEHEPAGSSGAGMTGIRHRRTLVPGGGAATEDKVRDREGMSADIAERSAPVADDKNFSRRSQEINSSREERIPAEEDRTLSPVEWVKTITERYSPECWYMLMQYDGLPAFGEAAVRGGGTTSSPKPVGTFHYLKGGNRTELLVSMETNVHELAHAYFRQNCYRFAKEEGRLMDWNRAEGYLYLSPGQSWFLSFPKDKLFPSRELIAEIPAGRRTFRFVPYIDGHTSTQSEGVIGLINELHAYYLGSHYLYDVYEAFTLTEGSVSAGLFTWVHETQSSMSAFYEFDFFIREYLLHMKIHYPEHYASLVNHSAFPAAYRNTRLSYESLLNDYFNRITSEAERVNATGHAEVTFRDHRLWVKAPGSDSMQGTPVLSDDGEKLKSLLNSSRYEEINRDLRL